MLLESSRHSGLAVRAILPLKDLLFDFNSLLYFAATISKEVPLF